jgi:hypothetical protein
LVAHSQHHHTLLSGAIRMRFNGAEADEADKCHAEALAPAVPPRTAWL